MIRKASDSILWEYQSVIWRSLIFGVYMLWEKRKWGATVRIVTFEMRKCLLEKHISARIWLFPCPFKCSIKYSMIGLELITLFLYIFLVFCLVHYCKNSLVVLLWYGGTVLAILLLEAHNQSWSDDDSNANHTEPRRQGWPSVQSISLQHNFHNDWNSTVNINLNLS